MPAPIFSLATSGTDQKKTTSQVLENEINRVISITYSQANPEDRDSAEVSAGIATEQAEVSTEQAAISTGQAAISTTAAAEATLAAQAAGAKLFSSIADGLAGTVDGDVFMVQVKPGTSVYENNAGVEGFLGWIGELLFQNVSGLIASTASGFIEGQTIRTRAEGFGYEVAASGATDHDVTTSGGVKLYVLPDQGGAIPAAALGTSPLQITADRTFSRIVRIKDGFRFEVASGVNLHFERGYLTQDWAYCFDISAGGTVTGDEAPNGYVTPQHWGALGNGTGNDAPAFMAAVEYAALNTIRDEYAETFPVKVPNPSPNYYRVTEPILVSRAVHMYGTTMSPLRSQSGPTIKGADGMDAIIAFLGIAAAVYFGKVYSGLRSRVEYLTFLPETVGGVRQGVVHNVVCHFKGVITADFEECGFHANAQTSGSAEFIFAHPGANNDGTGTNIAYSGAGTVLGNTNGSTYEYCMAQDNLLHGFVAHGNNSGTIGYYKCDAAGNTGAGFLENTTIGCEYLSCHSAQNSLRVIHNGQPYLCIKGHTADSTNEPGVGTNWETYWLETNAGQTLPDWATSEYYHPAGGVNVCMATSRTTIMAHYSEGGIEEGIIARNTTSVLGGNARERTPWHAEFNGASVVGFGGSGPSSIGFRGRTDPTDNDTGYGIELGQSGGYKGGRILSIGDWRDDPVNTASAYRFSWSDSRKLYEMLKADGNKVSHALTGEGVDISKHTEPGWFLANGLLIANAGSTPGNAVRIASKLTTGVPTSGTYIKGQQSLYVSPSAGGKIGNVCTTPGVAGSTAVFKEFGAIDA